MEKEEEESRGKMIESWEMDIKCCVGNSSAKAAVEG